MIYYFKTFKYTVVYILRSSHNDSQFLHTEPVRNSLALENSSTDSMGYHHIYPINDDIISGFDEWFT